MEINQALFESAEALTFDDVLVIPAYSEVLPVETDPRLLPEDLPLTVLADDDAAHFLGEGPHPGAGLLDAAVEFLDGWIHAQGWFFKCRCGVGRPPGDEIPRHPSDAMT